MKREQLEEMYALEDHYWWFLARRRLVRELLRRHVLTPAPRILDVGCGSGGTMVAVREQGLVYGCDLSPEALGLCCRRGLRQHLVGCPGEALAFAGDSFEAVLSCDVLEHIPDDLRALEEIARVLVPGGLLIATVPAYPGLWSSHDEVLQHQRRYTRTELRDKLRAAGLEVSKLSYAVMLPLPAAVVIRLGERLRRKSMRSKQTGLVTLPTGLNALLARTLDLESWFIDHTGLPCGTSLVALARKPAAGGGAPEAPPSP